MFLAASVHPSIAVVALDDLVGNKLGVLLDQRVVETAADQSLDGEEGVLRIGHRLSLGGLADETLAALREGNHRRRGARPFGVLDNLGRLAFHHGDTGVRGAEIDADNFAHVVPLVGSRVARPLGHRVTPLAVLTGTSPYSNEGYIIPCCAAYNRLSRDFRRLVDDLRPRCLSC